MRKFFLLSTSLFILCFFSYAQWSLGGEYKYHPKENQIGLRYDGLSNLNSNFNVGVHYTLGGKNSWGLSAGYTYHFDNAFKSSLTAGANVSLNFSTNTAAKNTSVDASANLGYYGLLGDTKRLVLWPKAYVNYRFGAPEPKADDKKEEEPGAFTLRPAMHVAVRF